MRFLSSIYAMLAQTRNWCYDLQLIDSLDLKTPVVSIGNLTVGGTGKTPITQMILDHYLEKRIRPVVVGRNYKAKLRGIGRVDANLPFCAQYFGDEPTLLAMNNPGVPVYVGPVKWLAAEQAEREVSPDVIVMDDGFQHRALHRDLDLVLMDATEKFSQYDFLPSGRGRESIHSLDRAHWVFLTKVNLAEESKVEQILEILPKHLKVLEVAYRLQVPVEEAGSKAIAFAGLAKPESFKTSIRQDTLYELLDFISFPDHHAYTIEEIQKISARARQQGAEVILTTEKDWTKIKNLMTDHSQFRVLELKTHFLGNAEEFHVDLDKLVHLPH